MLEDSSDYCGAEYTVSIDEDVFVVKGTDTSDSEDFEISDISWNGLSLTFHSFMGSSTN